MFPKKSVLKIFAKLTGKQPVLEQAWNFIKKKTPAQVFSIDFYKNFLDHFFRGTFPGACSIVITWITNFLSFSLVFLFYFIFSLVFCFTLLMFLFYLSSDNDCTNIFDYYKVYILCLYYMQTWFPCFFGVGLQVYSKLHE